MAKKKSMTTEEAIQAILASGEDNPLRMMLEFMVQSTLEWEMTEHQGAEAYERTNERTGYRNGYKPRTLITAVGDFYLLVPPGQSQHLFHLPLRALPALGQGPGALPQGDVLKRGIHPQGGRGNREALRTLLLLPVGLQTF
jgi:hypothetical protein